MENLIFLDSDNFGHGGKMNEDRLPRKHSLGSVVRNRLSDITNSQNQYDKQETIFVAKLEQVKKENMALRQHLQERNKLLELTGNELTKMRIIMQRLQQQNRILAQTNIQLTVERTVDKDRLKLMMHELNCRGVLLAVKNNESQPEALKTKPCGKPCTTKRCEIKGKAVQDGDNKPCNLSQRRQSSAQSLGPSSVKEQVESKEKDGGGDSEPCKLKRRRQSKIHSLGSLSTEEQVDPKEKDGDESEEIGEEPVTAHDGDKRQNNVSRSRQTRIQSLGSLPVKEQVKAQGKLDPKRQSARVKSEIGEPTDEKSDPKRLCLRRQSARLKSEEVESTEDLFEIEDARFPTSTLLEESVQDGASSATEKMKEEKSKWDRDTPVLRTSIGGRPLRRAAEKVHTYKEVPLNVKMRRAE